MRLLQHDDAPPARGPGFANFSVLLLFFVAAIAGGCSNDRQDTSAGSVDRVILVTGATGTQGGAVARELLDRGYPVRGLTRNPESDGAGAMSRLGAEMVRGDFDDSASLAAAMQGVYGVFAVTNFWEHGYDGEVRHGVQLVDAALAANVQHFVYTSVGGADENTGIPHFDSKAEVEVHLRDSGIDFSIVRPAEFMDNVRYISEITESGTYSDPRGPDSSHQWIAASDIGFFVGEAFDNPDEWIGRTLDIAGDQLTIAEFVDVLSTAVGDEVQYRQITWDAYREQSGEEMASMVRWFDESGYDADVSALRSRYPNLLTWREYLESLSWE